MDNTNEVSEIKKPETKDIVASVIKKKAEAKALSFKVEFTDFIVRYLPNQSHSYDSYNRNKRYVVGQEANKIIDAFEQAITPLVLDHAIKEQESDFTQLITNLSGFLERQ